MDTLFEEGLDEAQFQGKPYLYDYYLFLLLDKTNNEFKMSFDSDQSPHFSYSGTFNVIGDKITFHFEKSHPLYIYCEEDLLNITDMNFEHTVTFSVKSEEHDHDHPYGPSKSYRTITFNISPFIYEDTKEGKTTYVADEHLPNKLYVMKDYQ